MLRELIEQSGGTITSAKSAVGCAGGKSYEIGHSALRAESDQLADDALNAIPCAELQYDRENDSAGWIDVGLAYKAARGGSEDAYPIFEGWSEQYAGNTLDTIRDKWNSFTNSRLGAAYLFAVARRYGWDGDVQAAFADPIPLEFLDSHCAAAKGIISATPFILRDPKTIKPREWLYAGHYISGYVTLTIAPGGVGKSSLALVECVAIATGKTLLSGHRPRVPRHVWYINGEDPLEEIERRIAAISLLYGISQEDLGDRMHVSSGRDADFTIAFETRQELAISEPTIAALRKNLQDREIAVLVLDPFATFHGVSENDNQKISSVVRQLAMLAEETGCAIEVVHHTRKGLAGVLSDRTADDARGAGALGAGARSVRILNVMSAEDAQRAAVPDRWSIFRVDAGKTNMTRRPDQATWRQIVSVSLDNAQPDLAGDEVGVVTAWEWPEAFEDLSREQISKVQEAVAVGEWRENAQAKDWVGHAVADALGFDLHEPSARYDIKRLIRALLNDGRLVRVIRQDKTRRDRPFIEAGKRGAE